MSCVDLYLSKISSADTQLLAGLNKLSSREVILVHCRWLQVCPSNGTSTQIQESIEKDKQYFRFWSRELELKAIEKTIPKLLQSLASPHSNAKILVAGDSEDV